MQSVNYITLDAVSKLLSGRHAVQAARRHGGTPRVVLSARSGGRRYVNEIEARVIVF